MKTPVIGATYTLRDDLVKGEKYGNVIHNKVRPKVFKVDKIDEDGDMRSRECFWYSPEMVKELQDDYVEPQYYVHLPTQEEWDEMNSLRELVEWNIFIYGEWEDHKNESCVRLEREARSSNKLLYEAHEQFKDWKCLTLQEAKQKLKEMFPEKFEKELLEEIKREKETPSNSVYEEPKHRRKWTKREVLEDGRLVEVTHTSDDGISIIDNYIKIPMKDEPILILDNEEVRDLYSKLSGVMKIIKSYGE